jgi:hypothetical protein
MREPAVRARGGWPQAQAPDEAAHPAAEAPSQLLAGVAAEAGHPIELEEMAGVAAEAGHPIELEKMVGEAAEAAPVCS